MSGTRLSAKLLVVALMVAAPAAAELRIRITDPNFEPVPIAVSDFAAARDDDRVQGQRIVEVITNNLRNSGVFKPVDPRSFIQKPDDLVRTPRMADWKQV